MTPSSSSRMSSACWRRSRDLTPAEATIKAMAPDHRPDHRHHAGAALGVRAGGVHPGHFRAALPPVRRHHQRRHADLGGQRADAVAGALRAGAAPRAASGAASWRCVLRGIDQVRDGYAGVVRRLVRVAVLSLLLVAVFAAGIFGLSRITPTSFLPEEDQGAFFINVQLPDGASVARTSEAVRQVEQMLQLDAAGAGRLRGHRLLAARQRQRAQCRLPGGEAQAVRRPRRRRRIRRRR